MSQVRPSMTMQCLICGYLIASCYCGPKEYAAYRNMIEQWDEEDLGDASAPRVEACGELLAVHEHPSFPEVKDAFVA